MARTLIDGAAMVILCRNCRRNWRGWSGLCLGLPLSVRLLTCLRSVF